VGHAKIVVPGEIKQLLIKYWRQSPELADVKEAIDQVTWFASFPNSPLGGVLSEEMIEK
jgi:hypothetical protein